MLKIKVPTHKVRGQNSVSARLIRLHEKVNNNEVICQIKFLCPRSGSHRKVKQNDNLCPVQDSGSLAEFKVTARDQGHYKGPSGAFVTFCNISCLIYFIAWNVEKLLNNH